MDAELLLDVDASTGALEYLFTVRDSDGELEDSSTTPTVTLYLDSAATAQTATVSNVSTGIYRATATFSSITKDSRAFLRIANVTLTDLQPAHFVGCQVREALSATSIAEVVNGTNGLHAITVEVEDEGGVPVEGARVSVVGTARVETTESDGEIVLNLDAGDYTIRTAPPTGYETPDDQAITVSEDDSITFTLVATSGSTVPPGWGTR